MVVGPTAVVEASSAAETSSHNRLGSTNEHFSAFEPADAINIDAPGSKQATQRQNLGSSSFDRYHD
jgi:primase-polymerase (primpol)-like protein